MLKNPYAFDTDVSILLLRKGEVQVEDKTAPDQHEKNSSTNNDCYNPHQPAPTSNNGLRCVAHSTSASSGARWIAI